MSSKPFILYYDCLHFSEVNLAHLREHFQVEALPDPRHDHNCSQTMKSQIEAIFLPLGFKFGGRELTRFSKLKVIASNTTTEPDIDPECVEADYSGFQVVYLNDPQFLETITSTAEHTLGLILAAHRCIPAAHQSALQSWNRYRWGAPKMLSRSNLTIWGPGRVGTHLFDRAAPLFRTIWTIAENDSDEYINKTLEYTDVLALTMSVVGPQPVVNQDKLEKMPKSAIVVNTSRGEVLDHLALLRLLTEGHLWAAGLDVLPRDHALSYDRETSVVQEIRDYAHDNNNLILTPHIAGSTEDAWHETQRYVIDRVKEILL